MSEIKDRLRYWSHHRQRLGKQGTDVAQVLRDIIGVYSSHPSAPLSLYARVKSFSEQAFYRLDDRQLALRVPAMRLSVFMLPKESAHLAFGATIPPASDPYWQQRYSQKGRLIPRAHYATWRRKIIQIAVKPMEAKDYLLLAKDLKSFERFKIPTKDCVDLLPQWDSYTMGYAPDGRERFVDPEMQHHVYGALGATGGNALGTVLVNGTAHGSWEFRFAGNQMHVKIRMFEKPSSRLNKDILHQLNGLATGVHPVFWTQS
jgi:hypothetical protein